MRQDSQDSKEFIITDWDYDQVSQSAKFRYTLDNRHSFQETLIFKGAPTQLSSNQHNALEAVLDQMHIALGVSYYKAFSPPTVKSAAGLSSSEAKFFDKFYKKGLAEFAYTNSINLSSTRFLESERPNKIVDYKLPQGLVVPIGGGKDSLVTIELLKKAHKNFSVFSVGNHERLHEMARFLGLPYINVQRKICPNLIKLNSEGALNGHVPISGLIAFILAASGVLYGFNTAIVSHEASSNSETLNCNGESINHQYSKSLEFECDFQNYLKELLPSFSYFSLIRPLSELSILEKFSHFSKYHFEFTSCNGNFSLSKKQSNRWCCDCPKCRFTFLGLAAFMDPNELVDIFGHNLLNDETQTDGFNALIGWNSHKPFECVGTYEESLHAFVLASTNPRWQECFQVKRFISQILPELEGLSTIESIAMTSDSAASIPEDYREILNAA